MRVVLVAMLLGCRPPAPPPPAAPPPAPPCVPRLDGEIAQVRDVSDAVPEGLAVDAVLDASAEVLAQSGLTIDIDDRASQTLVTRPFTGEPVAWTCHVVERRQYAIRIAITDQRWTVGLDCQRSYGWEAYEENGKQVPAEQGGLTDCLASAKYATPLDAMRSNVIAAALRERLRSAR